MFNAEMIKELNIDSTIHEFMHAKKELMRVNVSHFIKKGVDTEPVLDAIRNYYSPEKIGEFGGQTLKKLLGEKAARNLVEEIKSRAFMNKKNKGKHAPLRSDFCPFCVYADNAYADNGDGSSCEKCIYAAAHGVCSASIKTNSWGRLKALIN